jgi:hypothetical protein
MKFLFSTRHWAAASWILTLAACSSDTSRSASIQIAENQQKSSAEIQWVQSPQKHNNSGIAMRYRLEGAFKVGQPMTLILEFSGANAQDAQFNISLPKGLSMVGSQGMQKSNQAYRSDE